MLDCELRPGSQHCRREHRNSCSGTCHWSETCRTGIRCCFAWTAAMMPSIPSGLLSRRRRHALFIIKRNPRLESVVHWHELAQALGVKKNDHPGKDVYTGAITRAVSWRTEKRHGCRMASFGVGDAERAHPELVDGGLQYPASDRPTRIGKVRPASSDNRRETEADQEARIRPDPHRLQTVPPWPALDSSYQREESMAPGVPRTLPELLT